jgi:hypothetical protein
MAQGDQSRFSKEIQIFATQVQEIEQAISDVISLRELDNATGKTLDYVGEVVGISRPYGLNDAAYLIIIKAKIQMNASGGEPERLIAAIRALTTAGDVAFWDIPFLVSLEFPGTSIIDGLWNFIKRIVAGGVELRLVNVDSLSPFTFDSDTLGLDNGNLGTLIQ